MILSGYRLPSGIVVVLAILVVAIVVVVVDGVATYSLGAVNTNACTGTQANVADAAQCNAAALYLSYTYGGINPNAARPTPCYYNTGAGAVYWNTDVNGGASHATDAPVCRNIASTGGAGNDPVTVFGDVQQEFWLPVGKMMPMLRTPGLSLFGATFASEYTSQQWFNRFEVKGLNGELLLQVKIKSGIYQFNRSAAAQNVFETLEVTLAGSSTPLLIRPPLNEAMSNEILESAGVYLAFRRFESHYSTRDHKIGNARRECVDVSSADVYFGICSAPANEYYGNFRHLAIAYAHLDLAFFDMKNQANFRGVFPELWGIQPMSDETKALIVKPLEPLNETHPEGIGDAMPASQLIKEQGNKVEAYAGGGALTDKSEVTI